MPVDYFDVVIVGAGHGGVQAATSLARSGLAGSIALVSEEADLPYERPPLSKGYLAGTEQADKIQFRTPGYWASSPVHLILGTQVTHLHPGEKVVETGGGARIAYGSLVWAAGGRARALPIPGAGLTGVFGIRSKSDIDHLRGELPRLRTAAIIGGGYLGLETAAAFRTLGIDVTVLEAQPRLLARVTGPVVSDYFRRLHAARGVDVRLGTSVAELAGTTRVTGALLAGGEIVPADVVIAAIGMVPNTDVLAAAGARTTDGVEVDEYCRTSIPDVYAVGDCTNAPRRWAAGSRIRLESVQNAAEQASTVSAALRGVPGPDNVAPWFWSNQYEAKLKTVGVLTGHDKVVVRGDAAGEAFTVAYLAGGRIQAMDCVNTPRDFAHGRALVTQRAVVDSARLSDESLSLRELDGQPARVAK